MKNIESGQYKTELIFLLEDVISQFKLFSGKYFSNLNIGVTAEQFVLLDTIYRNPGISQKDLASATLKNLSNITRILNILEENKLIYREIGKSKNYLIKTLFITDKGKQIIDDNIDNIIAYYKALFADFSDQEIETFKKLASKFRQTISQF